MCAVILYSILFYSVVDMNIAGRFYSMFVKWELLM